MQDTVQDGAMVAFERASRSTEWMRGVVAELERRSVETLPPTPIKVDNSGVVSVLVNVTLPAANRHVYRTICECRERSQRDRTVSAVKVDSKDNYADCLTKAGPVGAAGKLLVLARPASALAE